MRCYFCERTLLYGEDKVKFVGKYNGKRVQKSAYVCCTCSSMADNRWFEEQFDWDEESLKIERSC